jgi:osmoprotectant transport system permease protein
MNFLNAAWGWLTDPANWEGAGGIPNRLVEHLDYVVRSLLIAALIALPLGLLIGHTGRGGFAVTTVANAFRALPTLGVVIIVVLTLGLASGRC